MYSGCAGFWNSLIRLESGCWNWAGKVKRNGYGTSLPHRRAWRLTAGEIPKGLHVCHKCDNRLCCNPDHLFLGTPRANSRDAKRKGRTNGGRPPGSRHDHGKVLTLLAGGASPVDVAKETGMSERNVYYIQRKQVLTKGAPVRTKAA